MAISTIACNFNPDFKNGLPLPYDGHKTGYNDIYINSNGYFVVLTGLPAVQQALVQMLLFWVGESIFNTSEGMIYPAILNSSNINAQGLLNYSVNKVIGINGEWNTYLLNSHTQEDIALYSVKSITISDSYNANAGVLSGLIFITLTNDTTFTIDLTVNNNNISANGIVLDTNLKMKKSDMLDNIINLNPNQIAVLIKAPFHHTYLPQEISVKDVIAKKIFTNSKNVYIIKQQQIIILDWLPLYSISSDNLVTNSETQDYIVKPLDTGTIITGLLQ